MTTGAASTRPWLQTLTSAAPPQRAAPQTWSPPPKALRPAQAAIAQPLPSPTRTSRPIGQWRLIRLALGVLLAVGLTAAAFGMDLSNNPLLEGSVLNSTSSPRPQPTVQATPRPTARTYIVRSGDTLRSIARQFYGSEAAWRRIYARNRDRLADPESLRVGQLLIIPQG